MAERLEIVVIDGGAGGVPSAATGAGVTDRATLGGTAFRVPSVTRIGAAAAIGGAVGAAGAVGLVAAGSVGLAAGVVGAGVGAGAAAFNRIRSATEDAAGLSPAVAQALAETDIRRFQSRAQRARVLGPGLSRFERTRSGIEEQLSALNTEILKALVALANTLEPALKELTAGIASIVDFLRDNLPDALQKASDSLPDMLGLMSGFKIILGQAAGELRRMRELQEDNVQGDFLDQFFNLLNLPPEFWPRGMDIPRPPIPQQAP
jgi:hypothetical protein